MNRRIALVLVAVLLTTVGAGSVYAYAAQADRRALAGQRLATVLVASGRIPAGTAGGAATTLVTHRDLPAGLVPAGALTDLTGVGQQVTAQDVLPGEVLLTAMFAAQAKALADGGDALLALPPGKVAISVQLVDRQRVGRFVKPGDFVAVYATSADKDKAQTRLLFRRLQVLAVGATSTRGAQPQSGPTPAAGAQPEAPVPSAVFTLALDIVQGESLVHASEVGALNLGLESSSTVTTGPAGPVGNAQVFGGTS